MRKLLVFVIVVAVGFVVPAAPTALATTPPPTPWPAPYAAPGPGWQSCVYTLGGTPDLPSSPSSWTWPSGTTRTVKFRCNHSGPDPILQVPVGRCIRLIRTGTTTVDACSAGSWTFTNFAVISNTPGSFEFQFDLRNNTGSGQAFRRVDGGYQTLCWAWDTATSSCDGNGEYGSGSWITGTGEYSYYATSAAYPTAAPGWTYAVAEPVCESLTFVPDSPVPTFLPPGDMLNVTVQVGTPPGASDDFGIHWRYGGAAFPTWFVVIPEASSMALVIENTGTVPWNLTGIEFRCTDISDPVEYWYYWLSGVGLDDGPRGGPGGGWNPCRELVLWAPPEQDYSTGVPLVFGFQLPSTATGEIAEVLIELPSSGIYQGFVAALRNLYGQSRSYPILPGERGDLSITPGAGFSGPLSEVRIRCRATGHPSLIFGATEWADDPFPLSTEVESCPSRVTLGLNPMSWVPGLVDRGRCMLIGLFVPSEDDWDSLGATWESVRGDPPLQWFDEGVSYVQSSSVTFASWESAGPGCSEIMGTEVCPRDWLAGVSVPGWVSGAVIGLLWAGVVAAVFRWL